MITPKPRVPEGDGQKRLVLSTIDAVGLLDFLKITKEESNCIRKAHKAVMPDTLTYLVGSFHYKTQ